MITAPKVFISYSHDNDVHKKWVYDLACKLVGNGVDTVLDQWDLQLGSNLIRFMEKGLTSSDRVLVICTDNYNKKSNDGMGGVGYEKNILTAELFLDQDNTKFIPCIRGVTGKIKTPVCLGGRTYIDFSVDADFDASFKELLHELYGVPARPKPALGKGPFAIPEEMARPSIGGQSSTVFFSTRFAKAFPGVRGIQWFKEPVEAVERLNVFFTEPFNFRDAQPIWWWRDGDMYIDSFETLAPDTILIDQQELVIDAVAAVNAGSYYQTFIYIKSKASQGSGLHDHSPVEEQIEHWGYAREEFALFQGKPIRRAEYDDGAAIIDGKVVDLGGEAEVRVKYLSPYNLLLAPHGSPINNNHFDQLRRQFLNGILRSERTLEELTAAILKLPKRERGAD